MDDRSNNDSNDGVNVDDNEIDYGGANDFMGRITESVFQMIDRLTRQWFV